MYNLADSKTIDKWIWKNKRRLSSSEFRFGIDNNQCSKEDFEGASLRICVAFMSNGITRGLSGTYNALDFLVRDAGDEVFIDYSFFPAGKEMTILREEKIPYIFGNVSHAAPVDYDMIFVSHSIIPETPNIFQSLHYSGFPYNYEDRIKDPKVPLLVYGGAAANESHVLFGPTGRGGHSLVDIALFGQGEYCLTTFIKETLVFIKTLKKEGKTFKECKERYIDWLKEDFSQKDYIFHPTAYRYHYDKDNFTALRIEKLDSRVPDKVKFSRVKTHKFPGTTKKIFYLDGSSTRSHDVVISQGCSGQGTCCLTGDQRVFTEEGLLPIKELSERKNFKVAVDFGQDIASKSWYVGKRQAKRYTTNKGISIETTPDHKVRVLTQEGDYLWKEIDKVSQKDRVAIKLGANLWSDKYHYYENVKIDEDVAYLVGFLIGDGHVDKRGLPRLYVKGKEIDTFVPLYEKLFGKTRNCVAYKQNDGDKIFEYIMKGKPADKKLKAFINFLGLPFKSHELKVPDWVFSSPKSVVISFIKGYYQADGSLSKSKDILFDSVSKELLNGVQLLLINLGIMSNLGESKPELYYKDEYNRRTHFQLSTNTIYSKNLFVEEIGLKLKDEKKELNIGWKDYYWTYSGLEKRVVKLSGIRNRILREKTAFRQDRVLSRYCLSKIRKFLSKDNFLSQIYDNKLYFVSIVKKEDLGIQDVYDVMTPKSNAFIAQGVVVHNSFCMEGNVNGAWMEKDLSDIVSDMKELRRSAATNTIGFYSFNLNYFKSFLDLLKKASQLFSNLSLINMRTDVIAARPDYLQISKKMGLIRVSMAVEGMGDRIRNHILNKNLSHDQLMTAAKNVFTHKFIMVKMGMIITGVETKEDIEDWLKELDEIIKIRHQCDAKTSILLTHTPLQVYNQTPVRWFPRRMAEASFYNKKFLHDYIKELKKREGIQIKFHGSGSGAFLEQFIIDVGRAGTKALIDFSIDEEVYFASHYGNREKEKIMSVLKKNKIDITRMFEAKDPDKYIASSDLVEFTTPFKLKEWKRMHEKQDFFHKICLVTPAQPEGRCYGCGYCTPEQRDRAVNRTIENENTVDDIIRGFSDIMPHFTTRIVVKMKPEWELFSKSTLSHYISALFLRSSKHLEDIFFKVGRNTTAWVSANGQKDWFSGYATFDIYWKERFPIEEMLILKDKINESLHVAQIVDITETADKFIVKVNKHEISYLGEINGLSHSFLKDKLANFDEQVLTALSSKGSGLLMEPKYIKDIAKKILMVPDKDRIRVFMHLPVSVNPYCVVASITGWDFEKSMEFCKFEILDHSVKTDMSCNCGNLISYSLIRSKMMNECSLCLGKRILYKIVNKR